MDEFKDCEYEREVMTMRMIRAVISVMAKAMIMMTAKMTAHPMGSCVEREIKRSGHGKVPKSRFKVHPIFT